MLTDRDPENVPALEPNPQTSSEPNKTLSSPWRDDLIGQQVGDFRLQERLGGGAMASVYRATSDSTGQMVALKLVLPGADAFVRERFRREVRTISVLKHPNIVRTLEVSATSEQHAEHSDYVDASTATYTGPAYIAMELVEGESLAEALERVGQLSLVDSCALLAPVARALSYAHDQGIVHRDVKPSNILLKRASAGQPGAVRLAALDTPVIPLLSDFGIARAFDAPELTNAGRTIGTPAYMAPEQCEGSRNIDGRADIYALGAVLYRCLIGRPLFTGGTTQILHAHVYEPVTIPDDHYRLLSPLILEIVQLTLAKTPDERYPNAEMLADDLSSAAGLMVRPVATRRGAAPQDATSTMTMTSLPTTGEGATTRTVHVLVPGHATRTATAATPVIPRIPQLEAPIPLIPPQSVTPSARRSRRAHRRSAGPWLALLLLFAVIGVGVVGINWLLPRSPVQNATPLPSANGQVSQENGAGQSNITPQSPAPGAAISLTNAAATTQLSALPSPTATLALADEATLSVSATLPITNQGTASALVTITATQSISVAQPTSTTQTLPDGTLSLTPPPTLTLTTTLNSGTLEPTATTTLTVPTATPVPLADLAEALTRGREAYQAKDWNSAYEELSIVRAAAPDYAADETIRLLRNSTLALAAANNETGNFFPSAELIDNTLPLLGAEPGALNQLYHLRDAAQAMVRAESSKAITDALTNLQSVHLQIASDLLAEGLPCEALGQAGTALVLLPTEPEAQTGLDRLVEEYRSACEEANRQQRTQQFRNSLHGRLIFSAQGETDINIYSLPVTTTTRPALLIANAQYPAAPRQGFSVAYYNRRQDAAGLYLYDWSILRDPNERGKRLTFQFTEDSAKSAASWNWDGSRLVFASEREGDRRSRLYIIDRGGGDNREELTKGIAPAWRPLPAGSAGGDWIIYNGKDDANNNPGLWQIDSAGGTPYQLTTASDDLHPAWSPDGRTLYFMNASRRNHWTIFWAPIADQPAGLIEFNLAPIADSPSDELLPAVSPSGEALAFVSNRAGRWQILLLPLDPALADSDPLWLTDLNVGGQDAASWAEQALIWVN